MNDQSNRSDLPIAITLDPGIYFRCTCGQSQNLPFCDESHLDRDSLPIRFEITDRQKVYLCSCGKTANQPFCDGKCGADLSTPIMRQP